MQPAGDKAAISYFASSSKMMLAANSANQGNNKVARSGAIFDQNGVPKPGSQNRHFAVTHGCTLTVYIYIL